MQARSFLVAVSFSARCKVILLLLVGCSSPSPEPTVRTDAPIGILDEIEQDATAQVDDESVSPTIEPAVSTDAPMQNGMDVIKTHCARCHFPTWFEKLEKPQTEIEQALRRMETMGVKLGESEKRILLDYLATLQTNK